MQSRRLEPIPEHRLVSGKLVSENTNEDKAHEIAIRIVDEFEDLLDEKGIMVPSADR
jgi:hypothetical protein